MGRKAVGQESAISWICGFFPGKEAAGRRVPVPNTLEAAAVPQTLSFFFIFKIKKNIVEVVLCLGLMTSYFCTIWAYYFRDWAPPFLRPAGPAAFDPAGFSSAGRWVGGLFRLSARKRDCSLAADWPPAPYTSAYGQSIRLDEDFDQRVRRWSATKATDGCPRIRRGGAGADLAHWALERHRKHRHRIHGISRGAPP